ncbi:hypothetical protein FDP56_05530 [Enterococcus casseliflavus]|uniref:ATP-grasp fold amidoligase family protein n=1 Tax=Enterococcus casseliflavus TaxID=37734 RepID=UPI00129C35AC|nr:ATP-grasp fold amidoligase family protein [Enterococcus casseliflavus]MRI69877.1 hypothetical protein [Enterococcus casseliflavus]
MIKFYKRQDSLIYPYYFKIKNFPKLLFPKLYIKKYYKNSFGQLPDLINPKMYSEKLQVLKFDYAKNNTVILAGDKVGMREYVSSCGLDHLLVPIVGTFDSLKQIDWESLPNSFVMKKSNASGQMFTVKDKSKVNRNEIYKQMRIWMKIDFGQNMIEPHYRKMKSRIIIEEFLSGISEDWRIFYFSGEPKFVQIDKWIEPSNEKIIGHKRRIRIWTDTKGKILEVLADKEAVNVPYKSGMSIELPADFEKMIENGNILSKDFPLVRIDYFHSNNKLYLGELTFTPGSGYQVLTPKMQKDLGKFLKLPGKR